MPPWTAAKVALKAGWLLFIGAIVVGALALAAIQTVRLEGLHIWPLSIDGWKKTAEGRQQQIDDFLHAQKAAENDAQDQNRKTEDRYRAIAKRIEDDAQTELDRALRDADRFIAAGGLRREGAGNPPCPAIAAGQDHRAADTAGTRRTAQLDDAGHRPGAGLAIDAEAIPLGHYVTISAEDIRICTRNTIKAEAGAQLAGQLQAASANAGNLDFAPHLDDLREEPGK